MNKIYFFYGDDLLSVNLSIDDILKESSNINLSFHNIEKLNLSTQEDFDLLYSQGLNLSLFNQNSILKIYLNPKSIKHIDEQSNDFIAYIKNLAESKVVIVVFCVDNFDKITKKHFAESLLFKELRSSAQAKEYIKLKPWQTNEIKERISSYAKKINIRFEHEALNLFIDCFKNNLDCICLELDKLQLFLLPDSCVTEKTVRLFYDLSANTDTLFDSFLSNNKVNMAELINSINISQPMLYTLASLQNKFRQAVQLKSLHESSCEISQISKITGIHPYRIEKEIMRLKRVSLDYLRQFSLMLSECEYKLKSGIVGNDKALDVIFLRSAAINWL